MYIPASSIESIAAVYGIGPDLTGPSQRQEWRERGLIDWAMCKATILRLGDTVWAEECRIRRERSRSATRRSLPNCRTSACCSIRCATMLLGNTVGLTRHAESCRDIKDMYTLTSCRRHGAPRTGRRSRCWRSASTAQQARREEVVEGNAAHGDDPADTYTEARPRCRWSKLRRTASPETCVSRFSSFEFTPGCARTVLCCRSTWIPFMRDRSIARPPSAQALPDPARPPPRTDSSTSRPARSRRPPRCRRCPGTGDQPGALGDHVR